MKYSKRYDWIDLARTAAVILVVLNHCTETVYTLTPDFMNRRSVFSRLFALSGFTLGRLGVPLFLMISGFLLLDRTYDPTEICRFWKKNLLHLYICTVLWFTFYDIFLKLVLKRDITITRFFMDILFLKKVDLSHVWYMPVILGFYILIPFAANALSMIHINHLVFPLTITVILSFVLPTVTVMNNILHFMDPFSVQLSSGFSGGNYGCYLVFGYLVKRGGFSRIKNRSLLFSAMFFYCLTVGIQLFAYVNNYKYNIFYANFFLLGTAVPLFELFSRIKKKPLQNSVTKISAYSFGIYLTHNLYIKLGNMYLLPTIHFPRPVMVPVLCLIISVLSYLTAVLIAKIPKFGRYILYIR